MPVTALDLIRTASWISKCAASWAGDFACPPNQIDDEVRPEVLARFRKEIMDRLDQADPSKN